MTQVTLLVTPVDVTASLVFPTITAGANRKALLMISGISGATANMPTSLTIGGVVPTNEAGLNLSTGNSRAATGLFSLNETQIAAMSGSAIVYSGGSLGEPRLIAAVIQDTAQVTTVDKSFYSSGGLTASSGSTAAFDRIAESWTFFGFHCNALGTATMSNPSTSANFSSANSRSTIGYAADTARTISSSFTIGASVRIYAFSTNFRPVPSQTITSTNGGDPVKNGSTFSSVVTGFTGIASGTIAGEALSSLSYSSNTITATAASYVDGEAFYEPDTNQTLTYVNGVETASLLITTEPPDGMASVLLVSPNSSDPTYPAYYFAMNADDRLVYPTEGGDFEILDDSGISTTTAGTRLCWHWNSSTSVMTQLNITVNDAGEVVSFAASKSHYIGLGLGIGF